MAKFSADEICAIIKACGESGVSSVELGEFKLKLGGEVAHAPLQPDNTVSQDLTPMSMSQEEISYQKEAEKAQLMIDDPLAYEQTVIDGLIGDGDAEI